MIHIDDSGAVGHGFVDVVRVSIVALGVAAEVLSDLLMGFVKTLLASLDFVVAYWLIVPSLCGRMFAPPAVDSCQFSPRFSHTTTI
jgi:hypothetical protein